jgi:hypothetical protein
LLNLELWTIATVKVEEPNTTVLVLGTAEVKCPIS